MVLSAHIANAGKTPPKKRHNTVKPPVGEIEKEVQQVERVVKKEQRKLRHIPLLVPLLGSFGLVATFYGFEKILDQTFLVEQPIVMIGIGIVLLIFTGAAAQKL